MSIFEQQVRVTPAIPGATLPVSSVVAEGVGLVSLGWSPPSSSEEGETLNWLRRIAPNGFQSEVGGEGRSLERNGSGEPFYETNVVIGSLERGTYEVSNEF